MKLSTRARYALWMMLEMARLSRGGPLSVGDISKKTKISKRYLEQLATALKHAGLVRGRTGRGGGYQLIKSPGNVRLGEIVEAAIGPVNIVECVREPQICLKADRCEVRDVCQLINQRITDVLDDISLADLAKRHHGNEALPALPCPKGKPMRTGAEN